ncbi:MAG: hypothetical protein CMB99_01935 [Flavobacteriaceae bacterium]|nr:hypothetical protein [Flavobacteriaceae bacterium]|tara:strand:- start:35407 stop:35763 length:357 start_codon:yes stop_codon:yes gene_type:complete
MNAYRLVVVTENQNTKKKGEILAQLLCEMLETQNEFMIEKYPKFDNSFRIEVTGVLRPDKNTIEASIVLTDRICSPWMVTYDGLDGKIELTFNKSSSSKFRKTEFNVIRWSLFETEKV